MLFENTNNGITDPFDNVLVRQNSRIVDVDDNSRSSSKWRDNRSTGKGDKFGPRFSNDSRTSGIDNTPFGKERN